MIWSEMRNLDTLPDETKVYDKVGENMKGAAIAELIYKWMEEKHIHPDDLDMVFANEFIEDLEMDK